MYTKSGLRKAIFVDNPSYSVYRVPGGMSAGVGSSHFDSHCASDSVLRFSIHFPCLSQSHRTCPPTTISPTPSPPTIYVQISQGAVVVHCIERSAHNMLVSRNMNVDRIGALHNSYLARSGHVGGDGVLRC